jgi:hypothetical protein
MADYIIYTDEVVNMRVSCIEADVQTMATANNAYYVLDTFDGYELNQLEVVDGVVQVKSQSAQDAEIAAKLMENIRSKRTFLLSETDWTDLPNSPLSSEKKVEWQNYRTALRDMPANTTDLENPVWPEPPQ